MNVPCLFVVIPQSAVTQASFTQTVGSPVTLRCDTKANPSATQWVWSYNGNALSNTNKELVVDMDTASDAGTYSCRASNTVGQSANIDFSIAIGTGTAVGEYSDSYYTCRTGTFWVCNEYFVKLFQKLRYGRVKTTYLGYPTCVVNLYL